MQPEKPMTATRSLADTAKALLALADACDAEMRDDVKRVVTPRSQNGNVYEFVAAPATVEFVETVTPAALRPLLLDYLRVTEELERLQRNVKDG